MPPSLQAAKPTYGADHQSTLGRELIDDPRLSEGEANRLVPLTLDASAVNVSLPEPNRPTRENTRRSQMQIVMFHGLWDYWSNPQFIPSGRSVAAAPFVAVQPGYMDTDPIRRNIRRPVALPVGAYSEIGEGIL